jgi:glycosyltransferase involved in cell wall biosynthesis
MSPAASHRRRPDPRPVLFVTNHVPPYRVGAFADLHARQEVVFALIGGAVRHGGGAGAGVALPFPVVGCPQRTVHRLAASGRFRAVVAGLSGRLSPAAAYAGARAAGVPFVLWATLWAHPRTPAHVLSYLPVRHLYRHADAVATYGTHVSAYVCARGARGPVFVAPQSVDDPFWSAPAAARRLAGFQVLFAGRLEVEKGLRTLIAAWKRVSAPGDDAVLVVAGEGPLREELADAGARVLGAQAPEQLRELYAGSDVVVLPSIPTRSFLEPWGLTVNEAFARAVAVVATDAVGAAAGGLVVHERTGLVVPAGDARALAVALDRLRGDPALREQLGAAGRVAVSGHSHAAWGAGMSTALDAVGAGRAVVA